MFNWMYQLNMKIFIVISSIPSRSNRLVLVLRSLLHNTEKPDGILVSICEKYNRFENETFDYSIFDEFKDNPIIQVLTVHDNGPGTKIIGALNLLLDREKNHSNSFLLTADDDLTYKSNFIRDFKNSFKKNPNACWTGFSKKGAHSVHGGVIVPFGADGIGLNFEKLLQFNDFFFFIIQKIPQLKLHDDFIIACYLHLNGIGIGRGTLIARDSKDYPIADKFSLTSAFLRKRATEIERNAFRTYLELKNNNDLNKFIV